MTWEETIQWIRKQPEYSELVEKAYFEENLVLNIERFQKSDEYKETKKLLTHYIPSAKTLLDIGSGNGISAISFALDGFAVTVSEPDPSNTIGAGAIRKLKDYYQITDLEVYEAFAENIDFGERKFDIVYVRQAMHHAYDLKKFISNLANLLRPGGILITVRDHVIYDEKDKAWFLENHPLQKFYGGENAFTASQYLDAFKDAGLTIHKILKYYDSVINYFPLTTDDFENLPKQKELQLRQALKDKIGLLASFTPIFNWYKKRNNFSKDTFFDESRVPGRMYTFITQKA